MIRRNTASQRITLPELRDNAGDLVTSGATLTVRKDTGAETASAGTLAHVSKGVWNYTLTQAETDAAIIGIILTATGSGSVVLNLVTTAADTSAVALGANTATPLDATATRTALGLASANLDTQLADIPTVAEFNARTLVAADYLVAANLPANFAAMGINVSGHVTRVVLVDTTTTNADMRGTNSALLASSYTAPLDAAGTRTAVGLASANLDTQLSTIDTVVDGVATEVGKIPRGASAIAAGGSATKTKVSANGTTLVEAIT